MADLSERKNGLWGRERGDRANTEFNLTFSKLNLISYQKPTEGNRQHKPFSWLQSRSRKSVDIHRDHMEKRFQHIQDARNSLLDYASEATSNGDFDLTPSTTPTPDASQRHYRKHHEYSSCGEGGRHSHRPAPPRKPLRLSLPRASSLQSIEPLQLQVPAPAPSDSEKKPTKRNHKGLAPSTPSETGSTGNGSTGNGQAGNCYQSALRWPSTPNSLQQLSCRRGNLNGTEKWC